MFKSIRKWVVAFLVVFCLVGPSVAKAQDLSEVIDKYLTEILAKKSEMNFKLDTKDYEIIPYTDIMREREGLIDVKHTFYAEVSQYEEVPDLDVAIAHVLRNGDLDQRYLLFFATLPDKRLVEDDNLDVYGTLYGLNTYETVLGASKTIPFLLVDEALVQGIDY